MGSSRTVLVYVFLLLCWIGVCVWQDIEHERAREGARESLLIRSADITTSMEVVLRSQRRFVPSWDRLVAAALKDLVTSSELLSVVLLNEEGEVVTAAGPEPAVDVKALSIGDAIFEGGTLTVVHVLELESGEVEGDEVRSSRPPSPPGRGRFSRRYRDRTFWSRGQRMSERMARQRVHRFVLVMSTEGVDAAVARDLWLRLILSAVALLAVLGVGLAWRGLVRSADLRLNLIRSREHNALLEEKNIAAAGLAHETRNPLNLIRGMAQMLTKDPKLEATVRQRTSALMDHVDLVTSRLNEFLDYSRPIEPDPTPTDLKNLSEQVAATLETDREDKDITLTVGDASFAVLADAGLLRQVLFNLLLNAVQAVDTGGEVGVAFVRNGSATASIEVSDNGPGVPPEAREDVFRPYFTLYDRGTGLGLAVVRQIARAHGWEITCDATEAGGALFRITGLTVEG